MFTAYIFLLIAFSVGVSKKCDKYVVGSVWIHKGGSDDEGQANYEGCQKGCYNNGSYDENGVRKCQKCSEIKEETICSDNGATCRWKQGKNEGKCISQSCPQLAKNLNAIDIANPAGAVGRGRRYQECINGTAKEQYFNQVYIDDYIANSNTQNGIDQNLSLNGKNLCDDRQPTNPGQDPPVACRTLADTVRRRCEFDAKTKWNSYNQQQTQKDLCLVQQNNIFTNADSYHKWTGFYTTQEYCQHVVDHAVEVCNRAYKTAADTCYTNYGLPSSTTTRSHVETKAARTACHRVYHCMYSASNGRCSVWATWAVVFFIVVMVLLAVAVGVAGGGLFPKISAKVKGYAQV